MKTCLVVDDSSVIRKVARRILEGLEFDIVEAEDGEQALDACKRHLPDAILLDWNMPRMDGYEFLRSLRKLPGGDGPKVVFCTTENDVAHIARALHAGANEYIMKPFDKEIVEAGVVVRGLFARWVEAEPDLEVVASLRTGRDAVNQIERANPDVVLLDVDMPELDGIAALPLLLEKKRDLIVIMASTLTRRNAEISLRALALGAADYIPKPASNREVVGSPS